MNKKDLDYILEQHHLWRDNTSKGERADLIGAYLRDANLRGADLSNTNLINANLTNANLRYNYLKNTQFSYKILNHIILDNILFSKGIEQFKDSIFSLEV